MNKQRNLIPNIKLEKRFFNGIVPKDFYSIILPISIVLIGANLILITVFNKFNLFLICGTMLAIGIPTILLYEIEYNYKSIDILKQYILYSKRGDRLHENYK